MALKDRKLKVPAKAQKQAETLKKQLERDNETHRVRKTIRKYDDEQGAYDDKMNEELNKEETKRQVKAERNRRRV